MQPMPRDHDVTAPDLIGAVLLDEARQAGLLDGETEHVSFAIPKASLEAASRETGLQSTTELGLTALAILARPDLVAATMRRLSGTLGRSRMLED